MGDAEVAKLFRNGRSQAVRLPRKFRFEGTEVNVRRDPVSGDVILSRRHQSVQEWFARLDELKSDDFMSDRKDTPPQKRKKMF
jgi:antitoxin VapB